MEKIKETRSLPISNKIFSSSDIRTLARLFKNQVNEILIQVKEEKRKELTEKKLSAEDIEETINNLGYLTAELTFDDSSKISGALDDLIEVDHLLENKKLIEFYFYFAETFSMSQIIIKAEHSMFRSGYVEVSGSNRTWVNGSIKMFEEFLRECKNQSIFFKKYYWGIMISIVALLNILLINVADYLAHIIQINAVSDKVPFSFYDDWTFIGWFAIASGLTSIPSISIYDRLNQLWPTIEIQTGKDHLQIEKSKRNRISFVIFAIIIPTLLSFLPLILK